uniref:Uncharacterized protein n=1 Tax=Oryza barthii TaxID=65489 RepID=A0A0D3HB04_9ORYZ
MPEISVVPVDVVDSEQQQQQQKELQLADLPDYALRSILLPPPVGKMSLKSWCPLTPSTTFTSNLSIVVPKNGSLSLTAVSGYILQLWMLRNYTHGAFIWDLRKIVMLDLPATLISDQENSTTPAGAGSDAVFREEKLQTKDST